MSFTSAREKRLWLTALLCQLAIYASLNYVRAPTEWLRERNLLRLTVALCFLVAIVWIGRWLWKRRPTRGELLVIGGFALIYLIVLLNMERVEERAHFLEYGLVAGLIYAALRERSVRLREAGRTPRGLTRFPAASAMALTAILGWGDEGIQYLLPDRVYELRDVGLNVAAGVLLVSAMAALRWARKRDLERVSRGGAAEA